MANERLVGVTVTAVPVPLRGTVCGLPAALSAMDRVAVRAPAAVGRNVTLMVQLDPTLKEDPQVVEREKSPAFVPVRVIPPIVMVAVPVFRSVTTDAVLEVFNAWTAKTMEVGVTLATGAVPVPLRDTE